MHYDFCILQVSKHFIWSGFYKKEDIILKTQFCFVFAETPPCLSAKLTARLGSRPSCRPDGTYAPVQCHQITNYCWCVTPQGRNVPNTAVRHRKPRCGKTGPRTSIRSGQKRRSSPSRKNRRHHATCDREDKNKFNDNLIENFKIEYRRTNISTNGKFAKFKNKKNLSIVNKS